MRVAYLVNQIAPGGAAASMHLLMKGLPADKFEKFVYASDCRFENVKKEMEKVSIVRMVELDQVCSNQTFLSNERQVKRAKELAQKQTEALIDFIRQDQIDILHVNTSSFPQILQWIRQKTGVKIVTHVREWIHFDGINPLQQYIIDQIRTYSDAIIAISPVEAEVFSDHPNVNVIANAFDFSKMGSLEIFYREDEGIGKNIVLVAMLGRFVPSKGHIHFLKALKALKGRQLKEHFQFVLIGVSPKEPLWKRLARKVLGREDLRIAMHSYIQKNSLADFVRLIPFTSNVLSILKDMDIVVRPSLTGDPWGRDIIEAMALGKPIIATGSSDFFVENGITGYLTPVEDYESMANRIEELISSAEFRESLGQSGRKAAKEKCNLEKHVERVTDLYINIINRSDESSF